jgi:hypothetical protein
MTRRVRTAVIAAVAATFAALVAALAAIFDSLWVSFIQAPDHDDTWNADAQRQAEQARVAWMQNHRDERIAHTTDSPPSTGGTTP